MDQVDPLTELPSRDGFVVAADELFARARAARVALQLVHVDLEDVLGDDVLRDAAATIRASFRAVDIAGRIGTEELAVLCAGKATEEQLRSRVVERLAARADELPGSAAATVTVHAVDGYTPADQVLEEISARLSAAGRSA